MHVKFVPLFTLYSYIPPSLVGAGAGTTSDQWGGGTPAAAGPGHEQRSGRAGGCLAWGSELQPVLGVLHHSIQADGGDVAGLRVIFHIKPFTFK